MALSPSQLTECLRAVGAFIEKRRPAPEVRPKLDYRAHVRGSTVDIVSVRPAWNNPKAKREDPIARMRWIAKQQVWRLYWMRADLKWHSYPNMPETTTLAEALAEVDADPLCCFFG